MAVLSVYVDLLFDLALVALIIRVIYVLSRKDLRAKALTPWSKGDLAIDTAIIVGAGFIFGFSLLALSTAAGGVLIAEILANARR